MKRGGQGPRRAWVVPAAIFAAALALRVVFVLHLRDSPLADVPLRDELTLVEWARAIASGDWLGSEVFFRAPLYPYLLGAQFVVFRGSLLAARLFQAALGACLPLALYHLGRRVFGEREGIIAGAAAACYPFFIYFTNDLLIVSLATLLNVLLLLAVARADDRPTDGRWFVAGLLLGLSAIARPNVLVFAPLLFVWMWLRARDATAPRMVGAARRLVLVALGAVVVVLPVTVRNYAVGRDFVPIASQGGINFFIGNNPSADGASAMLPILGTNWEYEDAVEFAEGEEGRRLKPSEVSSFWYRKGREFIVGTPGQAAGLYLKKLVLFWDRYEIGSNKDIYHFGGLSSVFRSLSWLNFLAVAPLALLGMLVTVRRRPGASLVTLFVLSYMGSVLVFFVNARFRLPTVPVLILLAAAGATWLLDRLRSRDMRPLLGGLALLVLSGLFVHVDFYGTHVDEHPHTHYTIGLAHASGGEYELAVEEYRRAIEMWPDYASAYDAMGRALEHLGRDAEALEAYSAASERAPGVADGPLHAGILSLRLGRMGPGIDWLREATRRDPLSAEAHFYLGSTLAGEGRLSEAEESLRQAVAAEPGFTEAWNTLGRVLEDTGRPREALEAYERAIRLDRGFIEAHNNLAVLLATMGRYDESVAVFEEALRLAPGDDRLTTNLEAVRRLMISRGSDGG